jgi:hypothetical protein
MTMPHAQRGETGAPVALHREDLNECPTCGALTWNNPESRAKHQQTHHGKSDQS